MATLVKEVGTVTYTEELERSGFKVVSGNTLTTFNVSISGTPESHLWMGPLFNMPVTDRMRQPFQESFQDGGYVGTALEYLVTDTTNSIIVIDIDKEEFKVGIDGLHFKVTLPLDPSISGITSGPTTTNLYGAYMKTPLYEKRNTSGPCSTNVLDNLTSEESSTVTTDVNIGLDRQPGINPETNGYYNSGVVWLFCDDIRRPNTYSGMTATTNSWETGFAQDAPYTMKKKFPFNFRTDELNGYYVDQPVGIVDLLGGKITIFNEDLVNALDFSGIVGGDSISGATFGSDLTVEFRDYDLTQGWNMTLIAGKNEFQTSNNPTWDPSKCDGKVYITYIDFYDDQGNLVAKGVTDTPLSKEPGQTLVLNTTLKF
jgi:hypothetical protein